MKDIQQNLTNRILALMEDAGAWQHFLAQMPKTGAPVNASTGRAYSGINALVLWDEAIQKGYASSGWLTFNQAKKAGGSVRKGEKGTQVLLWKPVEKRDENGDRADYLLAKQFTVFNTDQCKDLPEAWNADTSVVDPWTGNEANAIADAFIAAQGATREHHATRAFYRRDTDTVHTPNLEAFASSTGYYGTVLHEMVHWTSHADRCDRTLGKRFGDDAYAFEELVAELGAVFLQAELGVDLEHDRDGIENHASYLKSWSKRMRDDKRAIIKAASLASQAAAWMVANAQAGELAEAA